MKISERKQILIEILIKELDQIYTIEHKRIKNSLVETLYTYLISKINHADTSFGNGLRKIYEVFILEQLCPNTNLHLDTHNKKVDFYKEIIDFKIVAAMKRFWKQSSESSHKFSDQSTISILNDLMTIIFYVEKGEFHLFSSVKILTRAKEKFDSMILNEIKEVPVEIIKEVPVEIIKEVIKEVPVEIIKEVPVEIIKEVIKEVPVEIIKEVPVEIIKEVPVEIIKEVPIEKIKHLTDLTMIKNIDSKKIIEMLNGMPLELVSELNKKSFEKDSATIIEQLLRKKVVKPNSNKEIYKRHFMNGKDYTVAYDGVITLEKSFKDKLYNKKLWNGLGLGWSEITPTFLTKLLEGNYFFSEYATFLSMIRVKEPIIEMKYIDAGNALESTIVNYLNQHMSEYVKSKISNETGEVLQPKSIDIEFISNISRKKNKNPTKFDFNSFQNISNWISGRPDGLVLYSNNPLDPENEILEIKTTNIKRMESIKTYGPDKAHILQASLYAYIMGYNRINLAYYFIKDEEYKVENSRMNETFDPQRINFFNIECNHDSIQEFLKEIKSKISHWRKTGVSPKPRIEDLKLVELAKISNREEHIKLINKNYIYNEFLMKGDK